MFFEGIVICFILLMYYVVGIRNGAVGLVYGVNGVTDFVEGFIETIYSAKSVD